MLRLIFAVIGMTFLPLQPIVGWLIFKAIEAPEGLQVIGIVIWVCTAFFQSIIYGAIIVDFWKKRGIVTMF